MIHPVVHPNGTAAEALLAQYTSAADALRDALEVLRAAAPNERDYYLLGKKAAQQAFAEHRARVERLTVTLRELETLAEHVLDLERGGPS